METVNKMIAALRIRGDVDVSQSISRTLQDLKLTKRNQIVVFEEDNEAVEGMMNKGKDFITYGKISEDTLEDLAERAGKESLESGDTVSLHPPSGGFRNTKKQVGQGGGLGKRDDLDELIQKMV
jgi:large subunit ribosomal protein L30